MEEKKLTDEELNELIKALEYQSWAQNCPELSQAAYMLKYQKAEIERTAKERERVAWNKQEYLDWVHGLLSTHTEMKDRGEDYKMFDRDWLCDILWLKVESAIEYIIDLENQRKKTPKASGRVERGKRAVGYNRKRLCVRKK